MSRVLTFGNFKGGVGKTTNSVMCCLELAKRGHKTLLIDLDPQSNATNLCLLTKQNMSEQTVVIKTTLMAGIQEENIKQCIIPIMDNLDLLPSSADFSLYPRYMEKVALQYVERVKYLATLIHSLKEQYDYIVFDIPPTLSLITDSALYASDYCIIVMQTQERSFQGALSFIQYIQDDIINNYGAPTLDVLGIMPVLIQEASYVDDLTMKNAIKSFGQDNIFSTIIPHIERLKQYDITGVTFNDYNDQYIQETYKAVILEILDRISREEKQYNGLGTI